MPKTNLIERQMSSGSIGFARSLFECDDHRIMIAILDPHLTRKLAVRALVHPATAQRWLRGDPVRSTSRARLEAAARTLGLVFA
jgi:hypothetical protein